MVAAFKWNARDCHQHRVCPAGSRSEGSKIRRALPAVDREDRLGLHTFTALLVLCFWCWRPRLLEVLL